MSHGRTLGFRNLAIRTSASARDGRNEANAPSNKPLVHGYSAYRSGRCHCKEICLPEHKARLAETKAMREAGIPTRKPNSVDPEMDALAVRLLKDGCTYREAGISTGLDSGALAQRHPGFQNNRAEFQTVMSQIRREPKLLDLHREIWQHKD